MLCQDLKPAFDALLLELGMPPPVSVSRSVLKSDANSYLEALLQEGANAQQLHAHYEQRKWFRDMNQPLMDLAVDVELDLAALNSKVEECVYVGEAPTGSLNAQVLRRGGGILILVNSGLLYTAFLILKVMARTWTFEETLPDGSRKMQGSPALTLPEAVEQLVEILNAYLSGEVRGAPRMGVVTRERAMLLTHVLTAAEKFVIAHEYSHLVLGHLDSTAWHMTPPSSDYARATEQQRMEFDADLAGLTTIMARTDFQTSPKESQLLLAGPFAFLGIVDMLERVSDAACPTRQSNCTTHPSTASRIEHLRQFACNRYGKESFWWAGWLIGWLDFHTRAVLEFSSFAGVSCGE